MDCEDHAATVGTYTWAIQMRNLSALCVGLASGRRIGARFRVSSGYPYQPVIGSLNVRGGFLRHRFVQVGVELVAGLPLGHFVGVRDGERAIGSVAPRSARTGR